MAILLHMLYEGNELELDLEDGDMKVIPSPHGKNVLIRDKNGDTNRE